MPEIRRTQCTGYKSMLPDFQLIDDVLSHTEGMRLAGKRHLPQEEGERDQPYKVRLNRSFFFEAYASAVDDLLSRPFSQEVTVEEMPPELEILLSNVDREGTTMTQYMREDMRNAINRGLAHTLVDMPPIDAQVSSAQDELERDIRPFFVQIPASMMEDWQTEILDGREVPVMIRYCDPIVERDANGSEQVIQQVREWTRAEWIVWRETKTKTKLAIHDSGPNLLGEIPISTWYINRTGFMTASPAMKDLAWENIHHWQASSDHDNIVRFLVPTLALYGWEKERLKKVVIGINKILGTTKPHTQAKAEWLAAPAHSAEAVRKHIEAIESRMERLGAKPLVERSANSTATGKIIDERMKLTTLQQWITAQESNVERCIALAAKWLSVRRDGSPDKPVEVPKGLRVKTFSDFDLGARNRDDMQTLRDMRATQDIDQRTILKAAKRRDILAEDDDVEQIVAATEEEKASPFNQPGLGFVQDGEPADEGVAVGAEE